MRLDPATVVVRDHDEAIAFFVDVLGFALAEDAPARSDDGRPKRWVVVRPPGGGAGLLLARAEGAEQEAVLGRQAAGRVAFFLRVDDFDATRARHRTAGVELEGEVREEAYERTQVFRDVAGNRWDLLGQAPTSGQHLGG